MVLNAKLATYEAINVLINAVIEAFVNSIIWTDIMPFMPVIVMKGTMVMVVIFLTAQMNAIIMVYALTVIIVHVIEDLKVRII
jgi:hypothetical protein